MSTIYILFGPPGSGKGTLATLCIQQFGWIQLSTGNLCREQIQQKTAIGVQIARLIEQGQLVPDDIIAQLVADWLMSHEQLPSGVIFDGYPRTLQQAETLYGLLQTRLRSFNVLLVKFEINVNLLVDRIVNRVVCADKKCAQTYSLKQLPLGTHQCLACNSELIRRSDDTPETLQQRLNVYFEHEKQILDFYAQKHLPIVVLDGSLAVQAVFENFKNSIA
ncbi:nucleoside monophosphate kinase [Candidatus Babeliales bacterium]|nr:nucleoside monophosphate kinase [Candidatus Babeliales bacterium]